MRQLIGRKKETTVLDICMKSDRSEFITVCGRRRIGKTYLIEQYFEGKFAFNYVGGHKLTKKEQLDNFKKALERYGKGIKLPKVKDWFSAFDALQVILEHSRSKRKVVFIDEMPWIDTKKSKFVAALENFWNGWATRRDDIVFIASGSATSWMSDKLRDNQGGLHNRITYELYLDPFSLKETEQYLDKNKFNWDRYTIVQAYMILGGIPFNLSLLRPDMSLAQNIDNLFFDKNGKPAINTWQGLAFENICMGHLQQIKEALQIAGIATETSSWRNDNAQIDLVIKRADRLINLCEMKFSTLPYEITADYAQKVRERMAEFKSATKTRYALISTFITTYGVKAGKHSSIAQTQLAMDDLFL